MIELNDSIQLINAVTVCRILLF